MRLYIASSWRNERYDEVKTFLSLKGHYINDWRENGGFHWHDIPGAGVYTSAELYRDHYLTHAAAEAGFKNDFTKMMCSDACVLLLPCGRSAHLEAGWFAGRNTPLHIYIPQYEEPELMYKFAKSISFTLDELARNLVK